MTTAQSQATRDLERYQEALRRARQALREKFVPKELAAILDTLNGHWFSEAWSVDYIHAEVEDAIRLNGLDQKWSISGPLLLRTLRGLSFIESLALADAVERWWNRVSEGEHDLNPDAALEER